MVKINPGLRIKNFNPRTHGECDNVQRFNIELYTLISIHALTGSATSSFALFSNTSGFQSTHSRGVRQEIRD